MDWGVSNLTNQPSPNCQAFVVRTESSRRSAPTAQIGIPSSSAQQPTNTFSFLVRRQRQRHHSGEPVIRGRRIVLRSLVLAGVVWFQSSPSDVDWNCQAASGVIRAERTIERHNSTQDRLSTLAIGERRVGLSEPRKNRHGVQIARHRQSHRMLRSVFERLTFTEVRYPGLMSHKN
jgi:hypothetical protein